VKIPSRRPPLLVIRTSADAAISHFAARLAHGCGGRQSERSLSRNDVGQVSHGSPLRARVIGETHQACARRVATSITSARELVRRCRNY
jgi:hypothetical protein